MSGAERRQWPRIPASLLSNVTASIIAGPDVRLVNLSRGGALMEVAARYPMRSKVRLKLIRPGGGVTQVHGTVSWAKVASISNGKINYLLAVIFESAIDDLSAATGIEDIENHASVSMVEHPFEGTEASAFVRKGVVQHRLQQCFLVGNWGLAWHQLELRTLCGASPLAGRD